MKEFIVVVFEDEVRAEAALLTLRELHEEGAIGLSSVGIAGKDAEGQLVVKDAVGKGAPNAAAGAVIGGLVGLLGGPVGAVAGGAAGAFIGTWRDLSRLGIGAELLEQVTRALVPGKSAVIAEVEAAGPLDERLRALGGTVLRKASADVAAEQATQAAERAEAARHGEQLPDGDRGPQLVKGRPAKSAHP